MRKKLEGQDEDSLSELGGGGGNRRGDNKNQVVQRQSVSNMTRQATATLQKTPPHTPSLIAECDII